jgi:hypothetical protein
MEGEHEQEDERVKLTIEQFEQMLDVDDGHVHTFRQGGPCLIGADWSLEHALEAARKHGAELSGPGATEMLHGAVVIDARGPVFFKTREVSGG